ncbi:MAG: hypothetical protein FWG23_04005 [Eggerthellaceae bacterium]|jgi:hypothetical protein|nr:hypothetical protein [Eggerthellaceae bacterium]MDR2716330.1 hypothetical protein [Coriobacteriaceae bacterium]
MKRKIAALFLSVALTFGAGVALVGCTGGSAAEKIPDGVKDIATSRQTSGNVNFTNYQVVIAEDLDWNNLSIEERQKIVDYGYRESRRQAQENGVNNFNIIGVREDSVVLFMYDRENKEMKIYEDGQPVDSLPVPEIEE